MHCKGSDAHLSRCCAGRTYLYRDYMCCARHISTNYALDSQLPEAAETDTEQEQPSPASSNEKDDIINKHPTSTDDSVDDVDGAPDNGDQ